MNILVIVLIGFLLGNILFRLIQRYYQWVKSTGRVIEIKKITAREIKLGRTKIIISPLCLVEVINALGVFVLYLNLGFSREFAGGILLLSVLLIVSIIDIETHTIPDSVSLAGILVLTLYSVFFLQISYLKMLYGALLNAFLFIMMVLISKGAMGGGDIRLAALLGIFLGWQGGLLSVVLGFFFGSLGGIILLLLKKGHGKTAIPFGPFLGMGGFLSYQYGSRILEYLY